MIILTVRTDKPEAEIGLYSNSTLLESETWTAHRQLAETLLIKISSILQKTNHTFYDIEGIVCYCGPGSFTGLRIGLSVANAQAYSLGIPIVGASGEGWIESGIKKLESGMNTEVVLPEYGAEVHITLPKH